MKFFTISSIIFIISLCIYDTIYMQKKLNEVKKRNKELEQHIKDIKKLKHEIQDFKKKCIINI